MNEEQAKELRKLMFSKFHIVNSIYFSFHQFCFIAQLQDGYRQYGNNQKSSCKHFGTDHKEVAEWLHSLPNEEPSDYSDEDFAKDLNFIVNAVSEELKRKKDGEKDG